MDSFDLETNQAEILFQVLPDLIQSKAQLRIPYSVPIECMP